MSRQHWIVTTTSSRPIKEIAKDLEAAGFTVSQVNEMINSISGSTARGGGEKLRRVAGVVDVSADEPIEIGPPGSSDTW